MDKNGVTEKKNRGAWYWCAAAVLFGLLLSVSFRFWQASKGQTVQAVFFGDSIIANHRGEDSVADRVRELTGIPVVNAAFGGSAMARLDQERHASTQDDYFSMVSLVRSFCSDDFAPQRQIAYEIPAKEYFDEAARELDQMNFDRTELMILCFGMNDYHAGAPLENPEDPYDEYTFGGAMRTVLRHVKSSHPACRIILVSPTYSWYLGEEKTCEEKDFGGGVLADYVRLEKRIAEENDVEMIDVYQDLYETDSFENWKKFTEDGIHPNGLGRELISKKIASYLEERP